MTRLTCTSQAHTFTYYVNDNGLDIDSRCYLLAVASSGGVAHRICDHRLYHVWSVLKESEGTAICRGTSKIHSGLE
jgi:hypothetical protein